MTEPLYIGKSEHEIFLYPRMANRHGLVAGATGTGKTVTLQTMAENFSRIGVPVFVADIKGDVSGVTQPAGNNPKVQARVEQLGLADWAARGNPVVFWDVFGEQGHPVRTTVSEMGPLLFARLLNLNDTQSGVLSIVFKIADDNGLLLLDLKDLRAMARHVGDNAAEYKTEYGNVSPASIGAIQRGLLQLEEQGADRFLGEPALNLDDFIQTDADGRGIINVLAADKLVQNPKTYATMLLWLLAELFETLPEVGDLDKPKLVFFFDEAHLLFNDAPDALQDKIEQVVRLIRSKGVGVFFVTQNPIDVPDKVLGQLGNRVQHALRAFTPRDQKAVKVSAQTFRQNPNLDIETAITQLGVGEALVSFLDEKGTPAITERAFILPPCSQIGAITPAQRADIIKNSIIAGVYEEAVDRESAYELLKAQAQGAAQNAEQMRLQKEAEAAAKQAEADQMKAEAEQKKFEAAQAKAAAQAAREQERRLKQEQQLLKEQARQEELRRKQAERAAKNNPFNQILGNVANTAGREITRGLFGNLFGTSRRRR
jgi:DNA helicase HerA-like ATPase